MLKTQIQNFISWAFLLSLLILCLSGCGKQKPRVAVPQSPPGEPDKAVAPTKSSGSQAQNTPPSAIVAEALASPQERLDSAKGTIQGPTIRIGLITDAREIQISAIGQYYIQENRTESPRKLVQEKIRIQVEQGGEATRTACFRIQVSSLRSRESAEKLRKELAETYHVPVIVNGNDTNTSNRVRVGEFSTKADAQKMLPALKRSGYPDAFIVDDVRSTRTGKAVLALRGPDKLFYLNNSGFLIFPSTENNFLSVNGKSYRGLLDVRLNGSNRITVVNQLRLEEYLLGVVPAEMNPSQYPEFDALAAQSIAARTYALKHMGRFSPQGFDLTDDTSTQVYGGVAFEKDASDTAVRRTAGIAIYYDGKLIDAMYMSTCGGRTEDFSNVYDYPPVPYLKSVVCAPEDGNHSGGTTIIGRHSLKSPVLINDETVVNRNLEFARILGIMNAESGFSSEYVSGAATRDEVTDWVRNTLNIIQKPRKTADAESIDTRIGFLKYAAESIFGSDEIRRNMSGSDIGYYVGNLKDGDAVPESAQPALAYLMQKSLWHPFFDNTIRPNDRIQRKDALSLLLLWAETIRPDILRHGIFAGSDSPGTGRNPASELNIKWGSNTRTFRLSGNLPIFRMEAEKRIPVESIQIIGNEKTYFHFGPNETIDFLEVELSPTGASSDRYSPLASWEKTLTRSEIASKLRTLSGNIGTFRDLEPARFGNSGRAVQIRIIGSRSSVVVNGYKVRGALKLRDTLFTLTRKNNPDGSIATFTFHGHGFGHGIGLCQVGAFGMAKAGKSYQEILKTYYQGVEIRKAY